MQGTALRGARTAGPAAFQLARASGLTPGTAVSRPGEQSSGSPIEFRVDSRHGNPSCSNRLGPHILLHTVQRNLDARSPVQSGLQMRQVQPRIGQPQERFGPSLLGRLGPVAIAHLSR